MTPAGEAHKNALGAVRDKVQAGKLPARSWEDFSPYDRCITRALPGGMTPGFYNHNYEIVQTPQYVAIYVEMLHDVRMIPLDGRPHLPPGVRQWLGESRGHWEGDTLVVETKNFRDGAQEVGYGNTVIGGSPDMVLVERFRRIDAEHDGLQYTVTDPTVFTAPWTVSAPMITLKEGLIFEYACHEGNHGIVNMLTGARAAEKRARRQRCHTQEVTAFSAGWRCSTQQRAESGPSYTGTRLRGQSPASPGRLQPEQLLWKGIESARTSIVLDGSTSTLKTCGSRPGASISISCGPTVSVSRWNTPSKSSTMPA